MVFVVVVPLWRYRVHRWEIGPQAVYTRSGWLVQERRIAPISRVQTVDTYRGPLDRLFGLANVTVTTASSAGAVRIVALDVRGRRPRRRPAHRHRRDRRRGCDVTTDRQTERVWHRLSPRMLLVHPVHEVLRQIPLLIGAVVLGSATGNPMWSVAALAVTVGFGILRWFTTTYRIEPDEVQLRTGILQRKVVSVPRNRIRSVQTDARLLHQLLGLTVLRVSTGQEAKGDTAFALDAVPAEEVPRLRAILLADSLAPADVTGEQRESPPGRVLARWQPSWLRYSPLSFTGLAMIARRGRSGVPGGTRCGAGAFATSPNRGATRRSGSVWSPRVAVVVAVVVLASVVLSVLRSLVTYGNLVLRRDADVLHLEHGLLRKREHTFDMRRLRGGTLRQPLLVRLLGGARLDAVMTGVAGAGEASLLLPPCPAGTAESVLSGLDRQHRCGVRSGARTWPGRDAQALDPCARVAGGRRGRPRRDRGVRDGADVGVDRAGGVGAVFGLVGRRPGTRVGASGGRALAGCPGGQPGTPPRLHRHRRHHRMDRAADVPAAPGRSGDAGRGHRGGGQALPGDRRSRRPGVVDRGDGLAVGGRQ